MTIRLKTGGEIILPVDPADIESIIFGVGQGLPQQGEPQPPSDADTRAAGGTVESPPGEEPAVRLPPAPSYLPGIVLTKGTVIRVGPTRFYRMPSQAAAVAKDNDVVEIDAGVYAGDAAVWRQNDLTIRGVGGRAHLKANGVHAEGKAIWVIKGNNVTVENIEFSGTRVPDRNGAGIRFGGTGLTVRNSFFHDNQAGIMTRRNGKSDIVVEYSEFARNGTGDGYSHNIYISKVKSFTLRYSYVHHAKAGHNVKTGALRNFILYNRIVDEGDGNSSYLVDIVDGGTTYLIGNVFQQGPRTENPTLVHNGKGKDPSQGLYIVNNTFVNDRGSGIFIRNRNKSVSARVLNNIFFGRGTTLKGGGDVTRNLVGGDPGFADISDYDYRLTKGSAAIDAAVDPGAVEGFSLAPTAQYVHPLKAEPRIARGPLDVGAYEFAGP